ncbi:MAG: Protein CrcB-like protein [candidate division TM6 bacterium GW2011_GWF2_28_16]|nr:MAG: Protein CrcB-like protein [candidate division TM6 bacterium GW2011_GWF2_28_16]
MVTILLIILGGIIGTLARYFLAYGATIFTTFNILTVNYIGSFIIGACFELFMFVKVSQDIEKFIFIGILGAFTTFSTYSLEAVKLFLAGEYRSGLWYIVKGNLFAILAVALGMFAVRYLRILLKS